MSKRRLSGALPLALLGAFAAGVAVDGWLRTHGPPKPAQAEDTVRLKPDTIDKGETATRLTPQTSNKPAALSAPPAPSASSVGSGVSRAPAPSGEVSHSRLRMPIDGEDIESLKGGFAETRGGNRPHEAVDVLAARNTPVHAVENGTIAKLFTSKAGGLTIYQFDPSGHLCYYYAHLERYADGLKEGNAVSKGDIIGYVGTSGNAPKNTPHLHFAVFELTADKRWWKGKALDPYRVFKERG
jgi:peptidoglycan LD-endopeptidase LytH